MFNPATFLQTIFNSIILLISVPIIDFLLSLIGIGLIIYLIVYLFRIGKEI